MSLWVTHTHSVPGNSAEWPIENTRDMDTIFYEPIGVIRSPFSEPKGMPIQAAYASGTQGHIEMQPQYESGLKDLEGFSHLFLLYHFHHSSGYSLTVQPFLDRSPRGVFATRAPKRPNSIGLSVVRLRRIEGRTLHIEDVDILDGTPLLDIKPYVPQFDSRDEPVTIGWLAGKIRQGPTTKADGRFNP